jgi:hypothetical protein
MAGVISVLLRAIEGTSVISNCASLVRFCIWGFFHLYACGNVESQGQHSSVSSAHNFVINSEVTMLDVVALMFFSPTIWYVISSTPQSTLWDPSGDLYVLGMNVTFPICKSEVAVVIGPVYILLLSLWEELVPESLSIGKLITPLWYDDAEFFPNAIGPSGASCGVISTTR